MRIEVLVDEAADANEGYLINWRMLQICCQGSHPHRTKATGKVSDSPWVNVPLSTPEMQASCAYLRWS